MKLKKSEGTIFKIPSKKIFKIWKKYRERYYIEIECPYCHTLTSIWDMVDNNRLQLRCYCEIPKNPTPKAIMIKLASRFLPHGWVRREGHPLEWELEKDKDSSQPLGVYITEYDHTVDYRGKDGFQATLGEFAGRSCNIAPLRTILSLAIEDCLTFMKDHHNIDKMKEMVSQYSFTPKYP